MEPIGYPIAFKSRDHSVVMRFLVTEYLSIEGLFSTKERPERLLGSLHHLRELAELYTAPAKEFEEAAGELTEAIERVQIEVMRGGDELKTSLARVGGTLQRLLPGYLDDENLLLFLLSRAERLELSFGAPLVSSLLKKRFGTLAEARTFLEKRYRRRGFHHVMPSIHHGIAQLEQSHFE